MNALSVQETYFWREIDQMHALVEHLMPRFYAQCPDEPVHIWSASCATGEEPLTIAMCLSEAGWFQRMPIVLCASDFSTRAIETARQGLYRERSFRQLPPTLREKYFERTGELWQVQAGLQERVNWTIANLIAEEEVAPLAGASIIFCRNTFIYFSSRAIESTANVFYRHMRSPGYLFLGASESLLRLKTPYAWQQIGGAFVYVKDEHCAENHQNGHEPDSRTDTGSENRHRIGVA